MSKKKSAGEKALEKVMEEQDRDDNEITQYISDAVAEKFVREESGIGFVKVVKCEGCKHYAAHTMMSYGWCCLNEDKGVIQVAPNHYCGKAERRT